LSDPVGSSHCACLPTNNVADRPASACGSVMAGVARNVTFNFDEENPEEDVRRSALSDPVTEESPLSNVKTPVALTNDDDDDSSEEECSTYTHSEHQEHELAVLDIHKYGHIDRVMEYKAEDLGDWKAFKFITGTIWVKRDLWRTSFGLLLLSLTVGASVFLLLMKHKSVFHVDTSHFQAISNLLNVLVAFLLGYFMVSSVNRWSDTVDGLLLLGHSVRNMIFQLHALGAPKESIKQIARYGLLSAKFLVMELEIGQFTDMETQQKKRDELLLSSKKDKQLFENEEASLKKVHDQALLIWVWIAMLLGRMAQDGDIPPMPTPTYGRLMTLAMHAQEGIRRVRISIVVQMPFVYVHTLALLVHSNNLLCAIGFGLTVGSRIALICQLFGVWSISDGVGNADSKKEETIGYVHQIFMSFITSCFAPLMYQAFLQIGLALSQPFGTEVGTIPTKRLLKELWSDLLDAERMAYAPPGFDKPRFKT